MLTLCITLGALSGNTVPKCSIVFISADMTGHWNVQFAYCCLHSLALQALCERSLSPVKSARQPMDDYQNGVQRVALRTLLLYTTSLALLCKPCKSYMTFPSWNGVAVCRQTWTRPSTGHNKSRPLSDKSTRFQLRIFQWRFSRDQFHRARWWQLWQFYGRLALRRFALSRLLEHELL